MKHYKFDSALRLMPLVVCGLTLAACKGDQPITEPMQGVLNFEPGTSSEEYRARIETEICPGASEIVITSGPEPSLDPKQEQVTFKCTP